MRRRKQRRGRRKRIRGSRRRLKSYKNNSNNSYNNLRKEKWRRGELIQMMIVSMIRNLKMN